MTDAFVGPDTRQVGESYMSLPHKKQLLILGLARFTEPLVTSSIQSYIFFQLRHFSPDATAATIATQSGLLIGCKTAAHVCTGLVWGALADNAAVGRKKVLLTGLVSSAIATAGYGFATTFKEALMWQMLDGSFNATIAMVRCMTAELYPEKRFRIRALTLLPLSANFGSLLGPLIGGSLVASQPASVLMRTYPYAAPTTCVASIQILVALVAALCLEDSGYGGAHSPPLTKSISRTDSVIETNTLESPTETMPLLASTSQGLENMTLNSPPSLSFRKMWTPNVLITLLAQFIISGHLGTFASLWAVFLSMPIASPRNQHLPAQFTGGVGLQPRGVGVAMAAFGLAGIVLQIAVYPALQERLGTIRLWRTSLCIFPVVYAAAPFCAFVASLSGMWNFETALSPQIITPSMSLWTWMSLLVVMILFAAGRTGVVPATSLLINDCTPHPSVRARIHTAGVIVSNLSKTIFPLIEFAVLGYGLSIGVVGLGFWVLAALAMLSWVASLWVWEGTNGVPVSD